MAKKDKKSKSPKPKGSNASIGSVKSKKRKTSKPRGSDVSKDKLSEKTRLTTNLNDSNNKGDITASIVNDDLWKCTVVIIECPPSHCSLPQRLEDLPNTAVCNSKMLGQTKSKKSASQKSRASSATKASKVTKTSKKTKKTLKDKPNKTNKDIGDVEKTNIDLEEEKLIAINSSTVIKQWIINLRNSDLGMDKSRKSAETPKGKSKEKNKKQGKTLEENIEGSEETEKVPKITHRYVILSGFYSLMLPEVLNSMLVPVKALITIKLSNLPRQESIPSNNLKFVSEIRPNSIKKSDEYYLFLNDILKYKRDLEFLEKNKDLILLNYHVDEHITDGSMFDWKENIKKILNTISYSWERFECFRDSQNIIEIPKNEALRFEDATIYNTMISMVPMECVSIPIIIHCMLDQVHHWIEEETRRSITTSVTEGHGSVKTFAKEEGQESGTTSVHTSISNDCRLYVNKYSCNSFNTYHNFTLSKPLINISPILINAADDSKCKTFHVNLPEFDFDEITLSLLSSSFVYRLWDSFPKLTPEKIKFNRFHFQLLKKFFSGYNNDDNLYTIHYHHFLMIFFLLKLEKISSDSEIPETDLNSLSTQGKSVIGLRTIIEDKYSNYFVGRIVGSIIQKVPKLSIELQNIQPTTGESMVLSNNNGDGDALEYDSVQSNTEKETNLQRKIVHKQQKLEKLKSFIFHPDLLSTYNELMLLEEEQSIVDVIRRYEFIEELDRGVLCQSLNSATQEFENVDFFYSSITDSILLWFNNKTNINDIKNSYNIESNLETSIGFRDFYKFKLGGKNNLTETVLKYNSLFNEILTSNSRTKLTDLKPITVYNLGPSHLSVFESHSNFFSPDSSYVKVKRVNYFDKFKSCITVSVRKNETQLTYEFDPDDRKKEIKLKMNFNAIEVGCTLTWNQHPTNYENNVNEECFSYNVDFNLVISLPSGLLIDIVRSDTLLGPFYVRQRYLSKGPTCSEIWEEKFRCYLKNGTILIFYNDGTADILYSNGTKVNCASLELKNEYTEVDIILNEEKNVYTEQINDRGKKTKVSKSQRSLKTKSRNASSKKGTKKNTTKSPKSSHNDGQPQSVEINTTEQLTQMSLNISEHSVIAWNGYTTKYENGVLKETDDFHKLRMAFDQVNQELYLQRSDKLILLYTTDGLTVTFPDGSRIASFFEDGKIISFPKEMSEIPIGDEISDSSRYTRIESEVSSAEGGSFNVDHDDKEESFVFVELSHFSEHKNYASVNFDNGMNEIEILLPGELAVKVDAQGLFTISGKDFERIRLTNHSLVFEAEVLEHCLKQSKTYLYFENVETSPTIQCRTEDSFGNLFSVDEYGRTNVLQVHWDINRCANYNFPRYPKNVERFFVFNRDLTGYEMIHAIQHNSLVSDNKAKLVKNRVTSELGDLFTLYAQSPIFKNHSQEYLMCYENNLPTLIRRKDLIKSSSMPDQIWFIPALSTVMDSVDNETTKIKYEMPVALKVQKLFKVKEGDEQQLLVSFFDSFKKYMALGEEIYSKYLSLYPKDTRYVEIFEQGELQKEDMFGSSSYYLTDNIKVPQMNSIYLKNEGVGAQFI